LLLLLAHVPPGTHTPPHGTLPPPHNIGAEHIPVVLFEESSRHVQLYVPADAVGVEGEAWLPVEQRLLEGAETVPTPLAVPQELIPEQLPFGQ
jgi:hypothetical protein